MSNVLIQRLRFESKTILVATLALGWMLVIGLGIGGSSVALYVSDLGTAVAALAAARACGLAAGKSDGRLRWVWILVGLSALSWGSGQVVWSWYELIQRREGPFPSFADAGFLAAVPFAVAGMLMFPREGSSVAGRARALIDGVIIALSALMTSWVFVLKPVFRSSGTVLEHTISLAYPIGDVIVVTIALYVILRARQRSAGVPLLPALIGGAFVAMAFSDSAFTYLTGKGEYATGTLVDAGWLLGFVLLIVASLRPAARAPGLDEARPSGGMLLPYVAVAIALVSSSMAQSHLDAADVFLAWLRTALIAGLVLRQVFILLENSSLTRRLEEQLRELRGSEQRFEALVQHSSDVVTLVDSNGRILYQSESVMRVFGHAAESLVGKPVAEMMTEQGAELFMRTLDDLRGEEASIRVIELQVQHASGRLCHAEMTMTNLLANRSVGGIVLNTRDMSERKVLQDQLVHEASHDSLTTLANRGLFRDRVEKVLHRSDGRQAKLTVLFLDLDGFKEVNDSLGHAMGDVLLIQVAERLRSCVRPTDMVARLGGDEFAVLIADKSAERDGALVADRITKALREPFKLEGREIFVGASIGIAATDQDVDDADHLLRNADLAMYRAKATGAAASSVTTRGCT